MKDHFRERVGPVAYAGFIPGRVLWAAVIREKRTQPFGLGLVGTAAASTTAAAPLVFGLIVQQGDDAMRFYTWKTGEIMGRPRNGMQDSKVFRDVWQFLAFCRWPVNHTLPNYECQKFWNHISAKFSNRRLLRDQWVPKLWVRRTER